MDANLLKREAARAALAYLAEGTIVGVGTGSTVDHFIDALGERAGHFAGAVSSSERSSVRLRERGIEVRELNDVLMAGMSIPVYVDGADEIDNDLCMIKGGGGALTREKIVAAASGIFVCVADASKLVPMLGGYPLPVEVIPMALQWVAGQLRALGGVPLERKGFMTDNGNPILDVSGLRIDDPVAMEARINQWPGVVTVGLFAQRRADIALIADEGGVRTLKAG